MENFKYLIFVLLASFILGCQSDGSEFLDKQETNDIYEHMVFNDPQNAVWYLNGIYRELDRGYYKFGTAGFLSNGVDEGKCKANWDNAHVMNVGAWGPTVNPLNINVWNKNYSAIRAANKFLAKVDDIPDATEPLINNAIRQRMKGEATFLRAMFHYELLKHYGGIPIVTEELDKDDDVKLFAPRNTYDECVEFIISEAEKALALVPHANEYTDSEFGRITKGAALALISRVRLAAASPLFNDTSNPNDSPFRGKYDPNKWVKAAEAARNFISGTNNFYSLHQSTSPTTLGHHEDFFIRRFSPEVILSFQERTSNSGTINIERVCLPGRFFNYGHGVINNMPVMNVVADYETVKLDDAGNVVSAHKLGVDKLLEIYNSGTEDPETGFDPQKPYVNRDPRFYQSIWYNDVRWPARAGIFFEPWKPETNNTSVTTDGRDWLTGWYNTGFFIRKFLNPYANITGWSTNLNVNHNWPIFRYAEILLNYAEAVNEAFGNPDVAPPGYPMSAREAVNMIRERAVFPTYTNNAIAPAGMPLNAKGKSMPPLPTGLSKNEMRDRIRHERRIELAFEEHRFWDVRRWMIGKDTENIYAQRIFKRDNGTYRYDVELLEVREWNDKFYRFPIMEAEMMKNKNLEQNPGWVILPGM
jgi:starch-binding outer membrane protein, SusD/RagB family